MKKFLFSVIMFFIVVDSSCGQNTDSLEQILPAKSGSEKVHLLNEIAEEFKYVSVDSVAYYSEAALKLAEELDYLQGQSSALSNLAYVHTYSGNKLKAIEHIKKAIFIDKQLSDEESEVKNTLFYANICMQYEDYDVASENYITALKYYEEQKDTFRIAQIKGNLGILYGALNDFENSLKYFSESAGLKRKIGDYFGEAMIYDNIGYLYTIYRKYDTAIIYLDKAIKIVEGMNKPDVLANLYINAGENYFALNNYRAALNYYEKSLKLLENSGNKLRMPVILNNLAEIHLESGQYDNCRKRLNEALKVLQQTNNKTYLAKTYKLFHNYYTRINNVNKAFEYFDKYEEVKDSININERHKYAAEIRTKYETEKKEIENEQLKVNLETQKKENQLKTILTFSLVGIILFILVSAIFIFRSLRQKNLLLQKENKIKEIEKETIKQETIAKQQRDFSRKLIEKQEEERERIAGQLHDGIGQELIITNNKIQIGLRENNFADAKELFESASEQINKLGLEVSRISHDIHPQELTQLGFGMAIESMVERLSKISDINFDLSIEHVNNLLNNEEEINYYRIVQESLNNIIKHSKAKNVKINIEKTSEGIMMQISDDGIGFDTENNKSNTSRPHFGLTSMKERAKLIGGDLQIESTPNVGTRIKIQALKN